MKVLKIFGVVVAIHAAVFMFVFAIPGCRSTSRPASTVPAEGEGSAASVGAGGSGYGGINAAATASNDALNPIGGAAEPSLSFNAGPRFNPTRPDSPAAGVLQSGPQGSVRPATTYTVVSNDSLWKVAKKHGTTVNELAAANNLRANSPLKLGQKLIIPGKAPKSPDATDGGALGETREYKVRPGESLGAIARRSGTTVSAIRGLNPGLRGDALRAGQTLILPSSGGAAAAADNPVSAPAPKHLAPGAKHRVMPGESLGQIARLYKVSQKDIAIANNITNPNSMQAGQELVIPGVTQPAQQQPAPEGPVEQAPAPSPVSPTDSPVGPGPESSPVSPEMGTPPPVMPVEEGPVSPAPAPAP